MGPGSFDPGSRRSPIVRRWVQQLQWGRGLSTPEVLLFRILPLCLGVLQWGRGLSTPEVWSGSGMGGPRSTGFNGAGVFRPRKFDSMTQVLPNGLASMGPGSFDPGSPETSPIWYICVALQWGRGLSTPEVRGCRQKGRHREGFNGAGVFRPRKCGCGSNELSHRRASMGPGSFDPGSQQLVDEKSKAIDASMGPGSFDPGSRCRVCRCAYGCDASMGPGSFDPGSHATPGAQVGADLASMGPGSFDPGSEATIRKPIRKTTASMGPGSFDPGSRHRSNHPAI